MRLILAPALLALGLAACTTTKIGPTTVKGTASQLSFKSLTSPNKDASGRATFAADAEALVLDRTFSGMISTEDMPLQGTHVDLYVYDGQAGERLTIEMNSTAIDPALFLLDSNAQVVTYDDDGAGNGSLNSRLVVTLPATGRYGLVAASINGAMGAYTLRATR